MPLNKSIYEDGNGGQTIQRNNEIVQTRGLGILAYLEMFGGNVEAETQKENNPGELHLDWWGNDSNLNSDTWINSRTEKVLRGIELSSSSIYTIKSAIQYDLKNLERYGKITINVTLPSLNTVKIDITIEEPSKKTEQRLTIVWNATRNEIIEKNIL